jgi:acyl-CoA reductase-like NAD-dependent aldehyde dehydrogenase
MLTVVNPADGSTVCELRDDGPTDVSKKFIRAKEAQPKWEQVSLEERTRVVRRFGEILKSRQEECARLLTMEMGKPVTQSRREIEGVAARLDYFCAKTKEVLAPETVFEDPKMTERIAYGPLGVVANISAWNYPYFVGANVFLPALLTGNSVLYKPSEYASLTGNKIGEMWQEAGLPSGVFQVVLGSGAAGAALLEEPLDGVFFTGSYGTGARIAKAASAKLMRLQLELGGKDPTYVCEDVDVVSAAKSLADGAMYNTGQSCCSVERIYAHEKIYARFAEALAAEVRAFTVGPPLDDKTYIGPLARKDQLAVLERQVEDAVKKGAKVVAGGKRRPGPGYYFEPTVLTEVTHEMEVMKEESFGPIIGIQKVASDEQAVSLMNDTAYGLTAGVYTRSKDRAQKILDQVKAGSLYWNCCDRVSPRLPWSGYGHSGVGTTLSQHGIFAFLRPRAYHLSNP